MNHWKMKPAMSHDEKLTPLAGGTQLGAINATGILT
jgi:hypothetical protein